jgi:transaldolase / glucose-6-phosphate isomerase
VEGDELVRRIWARDAGLWTASGEDEWLGWLDEPERMLAHVEEMLEFAQRVEYEDVLLLGMGGSSLAPEVLRRSFRAERFHVLDTTHPRAIERTANGLDLDRTLVVAASKSGTTLETRTQLDYFWERSGRRWEGFVAITDAGSALERLAADRSFADLFLGQPDVGGRYSALSPFGMLPAALMGLDLVRFLARAGEMRDACREVDGNPGLELGLALAEGWRSGRDKVALEDRGEAGLNLWIEQLLAESTGKDGKGLVPVLPAGGAPAPDVQVQKARGARPYELGQEFFRWEFATAVAGAVLGVNPFDQPNVQEAKDRTGALLEGGGDVDLTPDGDVERLLSAARAGTDYVAVLAFVDPAREAELGPLVERARATGCAVSVGLGPRYLHSTGQLHKGGSDTGIFVQVVDDLGPEVPIPGRDFGFRRLIEAQAAGDYEALRERGRRVARVRLEDL